MKHANYTWTHLRYTKLLKKSWKLLQMMDRCWSKPGIIDGNRAIREHSVTMELTYHSYLTVTGCYINTRSSPLTSSDWLNIVVVLRLHPALIVRTLLLDHSSTWQWYDECHCQDCAIPSSDLMIVTTGSAPLQSPCLQPDGGLHLSIVEYLVLHFK